MSHPRLSIIPAGAVTDRSLEPRDLQVLCLLGRHTDKAGWCVRSQVKMAQELACSRGSLQNSLDRLSASGWIEKKRRDTEVEEAGKQPSRSYAYRVLLDRDDFAFDGATREAESDDEPSYAETASEEGGCQPVGTPQQAEGVPTDQHPGANTCVGTGANTCVGTKNDPLERSHLERERDARAREKTARFIVDFEKRWPTAAADDRQRVAYAAESLTEAEQDAAISGIGPFLDHLKAVGRKNVPAGWRYLEEKRWTLLDQAQPTGTPAPIPRNTPEAKAVMVLHEIAGKSDALWKIYIRGDVIHYPKHMTPRLLALADCPPKPEWVTLNRQQAAAWEEFLRDTIAAANRRPLREGDQAPDPWPPSVAGKRHTATGPPSETLMSEQDYSDLK